MLMTAWHQVLGMGTFMQAFQHKLLDSVLQLYLGFLDKLHCGKWQDA